MRPAVHLPALALAAAGLAACGTAKPVTVDPVAGTAASSTEFDPASLTVDHQTDTYYMTEAGFHDRVDADAACDWIDQQADDPAYEYDGPGGAPDINQMLHDAGVFDESASDGLVLVLTDYCGYGTGHDGLPQPAGTTKVWQPLDCSDLVAKWDANGQDEWEQETPAQACFSDRKGDTVDPADWAYPDLVKEYYPDVYAERYEDKANPS